MEATHATSQMAAHSRGFATPSTSQHDRLQLGLAPALTPAGFDTAPSFFHGFATHPSALAQGLITLADITATRYFQFTPADLRDPVLTAHGDRLRAEVFSADNGVYARLDVLGSGLDGGEIGHGTTNVDIGVELRQLLALTPSTGLLHLDVGAAGLIAAAPEQQVTERRVSMPDRWVRAFGNAAELHASLTPQFVLDPSGARAFIASLPPVTGTGRSGWLAAHRTGTRLTARAVPGAVWIDGLHRFSALKRLLTLVTEITVYGQGNGEHGPVAIEALLPGARLMIALTESVTRGYSGEGALLESLAAPTVLDDATLISALLSFEPVIDVARLARESGLTEQAVRDAIAVLAASGRVGWDPGAAAFFHRELPDDPTRVDRDNPRLVRARMIAAKDGVRRDATDERADREADAARAWLVAGGNGEYRVRERGTERVCTCAWSLKYGTGRGPCAHILAVGMAEHEIPTQDGV